MPMPESLQAARLQAANKWPYIAAGLWALQPVEKPGLGTLGVDKYWRLYYDPALPWTPEETASVFYHEINHLLRKHPERAEMQLSLDPRAWNLCADAEINDDLVKEPKCKLPEGVVLPKHLKQLDGLLAEEYYNALPKRTINLSSMGKQGSKPGEGNCGSCAGGAKRDHEEDGPSATGEGKSDVPGISELEGDLIRHQIAHEIQQSASRGDIPEHLARWAKALLEPKIDWRRVLRAQVRHSLAEIAGQVDYTWRRLSRRQGAFPRILIPAMFAPVPRVAVVVDTSGSMGQDTLESALSEVHGILKACGQKEATRVLSCDAAVHTSKKVFNARQVELQGGGGTDMGVGIHAAMKDHPHLIVVLTDGYTPWPTQPNAKVIVCLVGQGTAKADSAPPWARVIKVEDEKA